MHELTRELSADQMVSLAERVHIGDRGAEGELLWHFTPRVYALLCARTRDREASRDLLQDTLIVLIRALRQGQLREPGKLTAFVLGIARNTAQSHLRSRMRRREEALTEEPFLPSMENAENQERERHLSEALS